MYTYEIKPSKYCSARPFVVVCVQNVLNKVKGHFKTEAEARRCVRALLKGNK